MRDSSQADLWLLFITGILYTMALGSPRAWTEHEIHLVATAKSMVETGDWIVPRLGDYPWVEKPPLPQWSIALSALVWGGFTEWSSRFPSACVGCLVIWLTYRLHRQLFGPEIGWWSALLQATTVYQFSYARLAESDIYLQACYLGALWIWCRGEVRTQRTGITPTTWEIWIFWALFGLMNLSKGLLFGNILITVTLTGWYLLHRDVWGFFQRWFRLGPIVCAMLIAMSWPLAVAHEDSTAIELWLTHTVGRMRGTAGYQQPAWYYFTTIWWQLLPWTCFLIPWFRPQIWRMTATQHPYLRWCLWWGLSQVILLSFSRGKHHHYLIHALPAFSPLLAYGMQGMLQNLDHVLMNPRLQRYLQISRVSVSVVFPAILLVGVLMLHRQLTLSWVDIMVAVALGVSGHILLWRCSPSLLIPFKYDNPSAKQTWRPIAVGLFGFICLLECGVVTLIIPRRDPSRADREFLQALATVVRPEQPVIVTGQQELARHVCYLQRPVLAVWDPEIAVQIAQQHQRACLVARRRQIEPSINEEDAVERLLESRYTRRERSPSDRYAAYEFRQRDSRAGAVTADMVHR